MIPEELQLLFDGFKASRILLTAVEIDVFTRIGQGATAEKIACGLGAGFRESSILLDALTALGLLTKHDGTYFNSAWADNYLREGSPQDWRLAIKHRINSWNTWSGLTGKIIPPEKRHEHAFTRPDSFMGAMEAIGRERAPLVAGAIDLSGVKKVLDLGGGPGTYCIAIAGSRPDVSACVFDLPEMTAIARKHIKAAGLEARITTRDGDLFKDGFGEGYDLVLISSILHIYGQRENIEILSKARAALRPGGQVVVQEFILNEDRTGPLSAAMFAVNMLVATETGNAYTENELRRFLGNAGFSDIKRINLKVPSSLMTGRA
ncbi:MAG: hypothetical protein A2583_15175 [Bdellovibrionales bacterium RIFOXYD1_FULL_53_11]|nr:MAG: hypothetical protein A2583_15175 [Bdellovibrionales bacterium RIFOXYD1_FULL_53_11]